eukprot:4520979-Lingulodinium_polyedra.AAC.1
MAASGAPMARDPAGHQGRLGREGVAGPRWPPRRHGARGARGGRVCHHEAAAIRRLGRRRGGGTAH